MLCFLTPHFQTRCGLAVLLFLEPRETESPPSPKTAQGPCLPPEGPFWPVSTPGGGTTRLRPVRGWFGPHRAQFGRRKRKRPILPVGGRFGGVKKEQVKGCGSVNRPTPGSQRPAEPVATGFLEGVKISKIRGQISGLGVKLWVLDAEISQC